MDTPTVVPDKLDTRIDYRILIVIVVTAIGFQFLLTYVLLPDDSDFIISIVSFVNPLSVAMIGFLVSFRYRGSAIFGKSYLFLSLGFLSVFVGEVVYAVYDLVLNLEPYPSIADIFFFAYSPFLIIHLILNIRFFQSTISKSKYLWIVTIPTLIISSYVFLSFLEFDDLTFDFYYGIIFVSVTSVILPLTILATMIFKDGILGKSWLILLFAILALTFADDWYYYLELLGYYDLSHPVNILWYAGYWIAFYALLKHKRSI